MTLTKEFSYVVLLISHVHESRTQLFQYTYA